MRNTHRRLAFALMALIAGKLFAAEFSVRPPEDILEHALNVAAAKSEDLPLRPKTFPGFPGGNGEPPLLRSLMSDPKRAAYRAGSIETAFRANMDSPQQQFMLTHSVAGVRVARGFQGNSVKDHEERLLAADDPLAAGLSIMVQASELKNPWQPELPPESHMPRPFRLELARVLAAIGVSHRFSQRAFRNLPAGLTRQLLIDQVLEGKLQLFDEPDFRLSLPLLDQEALAAGMQELVGAVEDFENFLRTAPELPRIDLQIDTPLGAIIIDTNITDNKRDIATPLLLVDVGGNDHYNFRAKLSGQRISIVLDIGGNDSYVATDIASCPAAAVLGYGILWDSAGNDHYAGRSFAQSAALFGAALLMDGGGNDSFVGEQFVQGYAVGGAALLIKRGGNDHYSAINRSQAFAGPRGTAVLLDTSGNDDYSLAATPVLLPSAQLPGENLSLGQGSASGIRAEFSDGISLAGGTGLLMDLDGNDRYTAQVFAQGSGYFSAVGLLVDGGGQDEFRGKWYVQGAAAHDAVGVLIKRGERNDSYVATHSTSIGAAHDGSLAIFIDEGGDDRYELGTLGLGAAHDNSSALFIDGKGNDVYRVLGPECRAFGVAQLSEWGTYAEDVPNIGIFLDLGGVDRYPPFCNARANDTRWNWKRQHPTFSLRSETGAGIDGEFTMPVFTEPRTRGGAGAETDAANNVRHQWRRDARYSGALR